MRPPGLSDQISAEADTRWRINRQTPILVRFDATQVPDAWQQAAYQGISWHFPNAYRDSASDAGDLDWFIRWPQVKFSDGDSQAVKTTLEYEASYDNTDVAKATPDAVKGAWYRPQRWLGPVRNSARKLASKVRLRPWQQRDAQQPSMLPTTVDQLPPKVRGMIQIVVTDRVTGRIIATSGVEIDRAWLASWRRTARARQQRRARHNEQLIATAFGTLAADLVASAN